MKTPTYSVTEINAFINFLEEKEISILLEVVQDDVNVYESEQLQHIYALIMVRLKDLQKSFCFIGDN